MNSKKLSVVLGVIVIVLLGIIGYMALRDNSQTDTLSQQNTAPNSNLIDNNTNTATDTPVNWKTYTNNALGFSLKYPNGFAPSTELNDQYNRLTVFGNSKTKIFEVRLQEDTDPDMGVKYGFLGADVASKDIKLGDVSGFKAVSTTGYGDAGVQGSPYVEFAARHNGNVYHLIFYGDAAVSNEEAQILSSFKFTK